MFLNQVDLMVAKERHEDLLREAEHQRLALLAEQGHGDKRGVGQRIVVWMGGQLVRWGAWIVSRPKVEPVGGEQIANDLLLRSIPFER
jgi:hypothetical protein